MQFQSLAYCGFLAAVAILHRLLPSRLRTPCLLLVSYFFYALWEPGFLILLLAVTAAAYFAARGMARRPARKKLLLILGLAAVLGTLLLFKYLGFFGRSVSALLAACGLAPLRLPRLLLPAGISFFSFAVSGYLIDVYRGDVPAERSYLTFSLFVSFFPAVLSGPIERGGHLLPQIREARTGGAEDVKEGVTRFLVGLAKKLVIADQLAILVNTAYAGPEKFTGVQLLFAAVCYSLQIYCDFSAYSDMAIGSARLFGFRLLENFDAPYTSRSIKEFWRRWHMSLSFWFRDYLYFPLGGSRKGKLRTYVNLLIVFTVSGLWHGAAWTFVIWGLLNGVYQVCGALTLPARRSFRARLRISEDSRALAVWQALVTFALLTVTWVFFRAASFAQAALVLRRIFTLAGGVFPLAVTSLGMGRANLLTLALAVFALVLTDLYGKRLGMRERLCRSVWPRWGVWVLLVLIVLIFGAYGSGFNPQEFVYFKF